MDLSRSTASFFFFLSILYGWISAAEMHQSRAALLVSRDIRELSAVEEERRDIYVSAYLRAFRGLCRQTGLRLDDQHRWMMNWSWRICLALGLGFGVILGLRGRTRLGILLFVSFAILSWGSYRIRSAVEKFESHDRAGHGDFQAFIDVFVLRGMPVDIYDNWEHFWRKLHEVERPYQIVAWAGVPRKFSPEQCAQWTRKSKLQPLMHAAIGANLPRDFFTAVFNKRAPQLDWCAPSESSLCDKSVSYGRHAAWQGGRADPRIGIYPWGKGRLLYAWPEVEGERLLKSMDMAARQLGHLRLTPQLEGMGVLRMDDPGAAQNAYLERWHHPEMSVDQWKGLVQTLDKFKAKMSVGYVTGWVDDGDVENKLYLDEYEIPKRKAGEIYPSYRLRFYHKKLAAWFELKKQAEFIKWNPSHLDVEVHGYTHISPAVERWLMDPGRYTEADWYREFLKTEVRPFEQRDAKVQSSILRQSTTLFNAFFARQYTTLIPPGHKISHDTPELAQEAGFTMVSGASIHVERGSRMLQTRLIEARDISELAKPDSLRTGLPMVLVLHDRDIVINPKEWFYLKLQKWQMKGVRRFITLRELSVRLRVLPRLQWTEKGIELEFVVRNEDRLNLKWALPTGIEYWLYVPAKVKFAKMPAQLRLGAHDPARGRRRLTWFHDRGGVDQKLLLPFASP